MISYLRQMFTLVKPYKTRLFLGVLCGFLSGLTNPLLMATVKMVTEAVFPSAGSPDLTAKLQKAPEWLKGALSRISAHLPSNDTPLSNAGKILVVSAIPLVMLLRGIFSYLNV